MTRSFLPALNAEWRELASSPSARREVRRWARSNPVLKGCHNPLDILRRRSDDPQAAPKVLRALAILAPTSELAARTLLHALMPGLVKMAKLKSNEDPNALEEMVSIAWERIRTFPYRRTGSVAANVLLDVQKQYRRDNRKAEGPGEFYRLPSPDDEVEPSAEEVVLADITLTGILTALRAGSSTESTYNLTIQTRALGVPIGQIAKAQGIDPVTLAVRRYRAERKAQQRLQAEPGDDA